MALLYDTPIDLYKEAYHFFNEQNKKEEDAKISIDKDFCLIF
jgi:hypothetical protein